MKKRYWTSWYFLLLFLSMPIPAFADAPPPPSELSAAMEAIYQGHFREAYAQVDKYIAANPRDPNGYMVRGNAREWEQKLRNLHGSLDDEIIDDFQKANQLAFQAYDRNPDNVDNIINLGNSYMRLGKKWADVGKFLRAALISKKCYYHIKDALKVDPKRWDAYMSFGAFNYFVANLPSGVKPFASIIGLKGNRQEGIRDIKLAAENPNLYQPDAQYLLKYVYRKEADLQNVAQILQQLHKKYPDNAEISYDIAVSYRERHQDAQALSYLKSFAAACTVAEQKNQTCHNRYRFVAYQMMGNIYKEKKDFTNAISAYKTAAAIIKDSPGISDAARLRYSLGESYEGKNDTVNAIATYREVSQMKDKDAKPWKENAEKKLTELK